MKRSTRGTQGQARRAKGVSRPWDRTWRGNGARALRVFLGRAFLRTVAATAVLLACVAAPAAAPAPATTLYWIWSPEHTAGHVPQEPCYFRKTLTLSDDPVQGRISIAANDTYELYLNGRRVSGGESVGRMTTHDISSNLARGRNTLAVKVTNERDSTAGLAARVVVKLASGRELTVATNKSWVTHLKPLPLWNTAIYNDSRWLAARVQGVVKQPASEPKPELPKPEPPPPADTVATAPAASEFRLEQVLSGEKTGSLAAMAFNEFGQLIVAQEGGALLLLSDSDKDGQLDRAGVYCEQVSNCQGLLALNGEVFVTGDGPEGAALYRLSDRDVNGSLEEVRALVKFAGGMGLHGPHGLALGPDGLLYVVAGSLAQVSATYDTISPHRDYYEGDMPASRVEDPTGHEALAKAPGCVVIRTDIEGRAVQLVAGGLRNAYDLAFNRAGDLFLHDSGNDADKGLPWHRPARLYQAIAGAEFGWRSGSAKWPQDYPDVVPPVMDTGADSPSGMVFYDHLAYPARYRDTLFLADRSRGMITQVMLQPKGAGYGAESEVLFEDPAHKIMDLEVGPEGALYFVTGGHEADGGVYRLVWNGAPPASVAQLGEGVAAAIRQPQLHSACSRQTLASLKQETGEQWGPVLLSVALSDANPAQYQTRALDLLQLFGPLPTSEQLAKLALSETPLLRAKVADLLGLYPGEISHAALARLLDDPDAMVRRKACEALVRSNQPVPLDRLTDLLTSPDRLAAWSARRLLERLDTNLWRDEILASDNHRLFAQGALALLIVDGNRRSAAEVLERFSDMLQGYVSDEDFIVLLRVAQVAMLRGGIETEDIPQLSAQLAEEFPAADGTMNRELTQLLAHLRVSSISDRYLAYLQSDAGFLEKMNLAMLLGFLSAEWTPEQRRTALEFYETAMRSQEQGVNYLPYMLRAVRDFIGQFSDEQIRELLAQGDQQPGAALASLYHLPQQLDEQTLALLENLDQRLDGRTDAPAQRLQVGVVAVLARSGDDQSLAYLREIWDRDPDRRPSVALGLSHHPGDENWSYLVRSLPILEGPPAREVLMQLRTVPNTSDDPEYVREVILTGLRFSEQTADAAVSLLQHWAGPQADEAALPGDTLKAWQDWYAQSYPERPPAELAAVDDATQHRFKEVAAHLNSREGAAASPVRGAEVFVSAQCSNCHRCGDVGEIMGPELTAIGQRQTRVEILQSITFPSLRLSGDYLAKVVATKQGERVTGVVQRDDRGDVVVLPSNGVKVSLQQSSIDGIEPHAASVMPGGLLDSLTLDDIADLFAFLQERPTPRLSEQPESEPAERK